MPAGCDRRAHLLEDRDPLLLQEIGLRLAVRIGLAQRRDRSLDRGDERRGVEVAELRVAARVGSARQSGGAREIDAEDVRRRRPDVEREAPAPVAQPRACPVELGGRQVARVQPVDQQHVHVLVLDRAFDREAVLARRHRQRAFEAALARPQVQRVELPPPGGDDALAAEQAQRRVGAVEVDEPGGQAGEVGLPPPVVGARERRRQRGLVGEDEALADAVRGLPEAVGEARETRAGSRSTT